MSDPRDPSTEQLDVHRAFVSMPRGVARMARAHCRCGWSAIGPHRALARAIARHEGRRP